MAAPTPQEQKLTALQKALAGQRQSQQDAKQAAQEASQPSKPTK